MSAGARAAGLWMMVVGYPDRLVDDHRALLDAAARRGVAAELVAPDRLALVATGTPGPRVLVDGGPANAGDFLWRRLYPAERAALGVKLQAAREAGLRWQVRHTLVVPA